MLKRGACHNLHVRNRQSSIRDLALLDLQKTRDSIKNNKRDDVIILLSVMSSVMSASAVSEEERESLVV